MMDHVSDTHRKGLSNQLFTGQSKYLINTNKTLKGNKLHTNDHINIQLLKFRNCSANVYHENKAKLTINHHIDNQFNHKYKPYEINNTQDSFYKTISEKRRKNTEEVKNKLKMFETNRGDMQILQFYHSNQKHFLLNERIIQKSTKRKEERIINMNKTISFHKYQKSPERPSSSNKKMFCTSANLGKTMNEYLNKVVLQKNAVKYHEEEIVNNCRTIEFHHKLKESNLDKGLGKKMNLNSYLRNMKRFKKIKQNLDKQNQNNLSKKTHKKDNPSAELSDGKYHQKYHTITTFFKTEDSITLQSKTLDFKPIFSTANHHEKNNIPH